MRGAGIGITPPAGAPADADYLVGTSNGDLSAEIVVGTSPGGELGGTWASPTVDSVHSGSAHHAAESGQSVTHTHAGHDTAHAHADLTGVSANQHHVAFVQADHDALPNPHHSNANDHAESHTHASHTSIGANDHHNQSHDHSAAGDGTSLIPAVLEIPNGAGGTTVDAAGEATIDTTSRTLNFHDGTAEVVLNPVESLSFVIENPVATDDLAFYRMRSAVTLIETDYLCVGGTNWVGQVQEADANGASPADTQSADSTATAGTNVQVTSYSNATIDAGDYLYLKTTSISGTPTSLVVTIYFRQDA